VDAVPSRLSAAVRAMRRKKTTLYVPGHGPLAREAEYDRYVAVIDEIEKAARAGRAAGKTAAEAATGFQLPESLGKWTLFSPQYFERAIGAWYKELGGG
jgi:ribulose-5-phosphate 4-epimerase/fuculose-1-phosphate aldolase